MRRSWLIVFPLLVILIVPSLAAHAPDFYFTAAVLQSLYKFEEGREIMAKTPDDATLAVKIRAMENGLADWREGRKIITPHLPKPVAVAIDDGLSVFIRNGEQAVGLLNRAARGDMPSEDETIGQAGGMEEEEDRAYRSIGNAVSDFVPQGLTKAEKGVLLFRIDLLFGKSLKDDRRNEIVAAVSHLEDRLKGRTK